jgi:thiamine biosynthesis protein ThiI
MTSLVIHYQEIALKGRNRPWFIGRLVKNLRKATADLGVRDVRALMGRLELVAGPDTPWAELVGRVQHTFGIANFSRAGRAPLDLDAMAAAILSDLAGRQPASFRVSARRADKRFPLTSPQIEREVGGRIKMATGWRVDLERPDLTVYLEVLSTEAFYFFDKERGPGGLPVGVSGRVVCLLSGGIDSPVAAWRMMKRGCNVVLLHFHSYPITSAVSQQKVRELTRVLTRYQLDSRLCLAPFGDIQRRVVLSVPPPVRVVIYRRLMMRIAAAIARKSRAQALVTGEVVGQVASQTLENLAVINAVTSLPVLRPLIGMDKDEITAEAQRLETYPISIIPDEDCCQVFTPKHPVTRARLRDIVAAEEALPIEEFVQAAVEGMAVEDFHFPDRPHAIVTSLAR